MPVTPELMLRSRPAGRIRPQLDRLRCVLEEIGNPHQGLRSILVVGTNGKGSTAAMLDSILSEHGVKTGLYTSPHLVRAEERIRVDGETVSAEDFAHELAILEGYEDLTFFEVLTAAALSVFARRGVEIAVLEAGMGGSWDATRLAGSEIAGLTNIGSDHTSWLGADRAQRARDKGRALDAARWAVVGRGVGVDDLVAVDAPHAVFAEELVGCEDLGDGMVSLEFNGREMVVELPLAGAFQRDNAQLAVALALQAVAAGWLGKIDHRLLGRAIAQTRWPGRLSSHQIAGREVLVDCAHNLEAAGALAAHLKNLDQRYNLIFSCLEDKPVEEMAALLRPEVGSVTICRLDDARAMPIERLAAAFPRALIGADPFACLELVSNPVLAAGSIRLVGGLLAHAGESP